MESPAKLSKRTTVNRTATGGSNGGGGEGWGMGFLLVFFPQDHNHNHHNDSSPTFKSPPVNAVIKRSNSTNIITKAQSTISVCALVIFFTLLLFTLSTFEPNNTSSSHQHRRHLSQSVTKTQPNLPALQRLGTLYYRGTKPMNDVVLCHVPESTTLTEIKSFSRAFYVSGLLSKSDLVFIFPSITTPEFYDNLIMEENHLFLKVIRRYKSKFSNSSNVSNFTASNFPTKNFPASDFPASFDVSQYVKTGKISNKGETVWGRKIKTGVNSNSSNESGTELTRLSYGSVVGFGVGELDPENALSGFMDHVPMGLRRWASYPMLLGRLRRNYKHVMLVDVKEVLVLGDPLTRVRTRSPESVFLPSNKLHNRKDKTHPRPVNPSVIVGGARGVRRLSAAMLTEIVRAEDSRRNKRKGSVTESALLSRLVANEVVNKNINLVASGESVPEASSLGGVVIANNYTVVRRGSSNIDMELTKHICSFAIEATVYAECRKYNLSSV